MSFLLAINEQQFAAPVTAEHHVVYDIHTAHESHTEPVLGDERESDAEFADLGGRLAHEILFPARSRIIVDDRAAVRTLESGDSFQNLALSAARDTGYAEDLP